MRNQKFFSRNFFRGDTFFFDCKTNTFKDLNYAIFQYQKSLAGLNSLEKKLKDKDPKFFLDIAHLFNRTK